MGTQWDVWNITHSQISQDISTYSGFGDRNVEPLTMEKLKMADLKIGVWGDYRSGKLTICCLRK